MCGCSGSLHIGNLPQGKWCQGISRHGVPKLPPAGGGSVGSLEGGGKASYNSGSRRKQGGTTPQGIPHQDLHGHGCTIRGYGHSGFGQKGTRRFLALLRGLCTGTTHALWTLPESGWTLCNGDFGKTKGPGREGANMPPQRDMPGLWKGTGGVSLWRTCGGLRKRRPQMRGMRAGRTPFGTQANGPPVLPVIQE